MRSEKESEDGINQLRMRLFRMKGLDYLIDWLMDDG